MADDPVKAALAALGVAHIAVRQAIDALQQTPAGREYAEPTKRKRRPDPVAVRQPLPAPLTPAPRAPVVSSNATKAENQAAVVIIAKRVVAAVGPDSPMVRPGVVGQLALQKIPHDDEMIDAAIQTALAG